MNIYDLLSCNNPEISRVSGGASSSSCADIRRKLHSQGSDMRLERQNEHPSEYSNALTTLEKM